MMRYSAGNFTLLASRAFMALMALMAFLAFVFMVSCTEEPAPPVKPEVLQYLPLNNATNISVLDSVKFVFNTPMDVQSTFNSLTTTPKIGGVYFWGDKKKSFTIKSGEYLEGNTRYTVSLDDSARSLDGVTLGKKVSFSFTTGNQIPKVKSIDPTLTETNVSLSKIIRLTFNTPMDPQSSSSISVTDSANTVVSGSQTWEANGTVAVFSPLSPLIENTLYQVLISAQAKSDKGVAMLNSQTFSFRSAAKPFIKNIQPADSTLLVARSAVVYVQFDIPMDTLTTESAFSLKDSNQVKQSGTFSWKLPYSFEFKPDASLAATMKYTVVITTQARSTHGLQVAKDFSTFFVTKATSPLPSLQKP